MIEKLKETYQNKKVFLTGHTGFKGAWLLKTLDFLGAEVKGYALPPHTSDDLYCLINGDSLCESVIDDLRNAKKLEEEILNFQPDFVFHLAAQPLVRLSYEKPIETFETNVIGTVNVLNSIRSLEKTCNSILITTDKVYYNKEWLYPYREIDRLGGYDPYSASKACCELVIDSYKNSYFNPKAYSDHKKGIAVARAGNVIGGGDWSKDRLIPDIIKSLLKEETISIRNPESIRPWQHVLEPIVGYLVLGRHLIKDPIKYSQVYNFGPDNNDTISVEELLNLVLDSWGAGSFEVHKGGHQPHEAGLLKLDITKALVDLNWRPRFNVKKTVDYTLAWYKEYKLNRGNIEKFTSNQIIEFLTFLHGK